MAKPNPKNIEVTWEDQQSINTFNRLNNRKYELDAQVKALKKTLEDLEDAGNELMLSDEESIRYGYGDCYVHINKDNAEEKINELTSKSQAELDEVAAELEEVLGNMKVLKGTLYGKFGTSINLEDD